MPVPQSLEGTVEGSQEVTEKDREFLFRSREQAAFLAEASRALAESFQYEDTLEKLARIALRNLCDWCIIDVKSENDDFFRLNVFHVDPAKEDLARELKEQYPPHFSSRGVPSEVMRTGKPLLVPHVTEKHYEETRRSGRHEEILRAMGSESYMCIPLLARGKFLGAITFASSEPGAPYDMDDLLFAEELCGRAAIAVDNALLYRQAQQEIFRREELMGIVSHDLKSPLASILLGANMILHKNTTPTAQERAVNNIKHAVERMNRLISDLLDLSQADVGKFSLHLEDVCLTALINETVDVFKPIALEKGVELNVVVESNLCANCDSERLIQAISNLLSNAIKFTPNLGVVKLTAYRGENGITICIEDTGSGIAAGDLPRLFDRFWKGDRESRQGTGLGLSIVKAVMDAHGGTIGVDSTLGRGTQFTLHLPQGGGPDEKYQH